MKALRDEAIDVISKLPKSADIDEIMYRLYVIDKMNKGQEAIRDRKTVSLENLKKELETW